jgi:hypothetical protein
MLRDQLIRAERAPGELRDRLDMLAIQECSMSKLGQDHPLTRGVPGKVARNFLQM